MDSITVGIDVSENHLDVAVRPSGDVFAVERNAAGLEQLAARLRELSPHIIALEATGGFETIAAAALAAAQLPGRCRQPSPDPCLRQGDRTACQERSDRRRGHRPLRRGDQTRTTSAAGHGDAVAGRSHHPPAADRRNDRGRTPTRDTGDHPTPAQEHRTAAQDVAEELASLDADIDDSVRGSPLWREKEDLLASVPGVGPTIARTLIADLTVRRLLRLQAWRRSPASPASGGAAASSAAGAQSCE